MGERGRGDDRLQQGQGAREGQMAGFIREGLHGMGAAFRIGKDDLPRPKGMWIRLCWTANPYPTETLTLEETPSFARRDNDTTSQPKATSVRT